MASSSTSSTRQINRTVWFIIGMAALTIAAIGIENALSAHGTVMAVWAAVCAFLAGYFAGRARQGARTDSKAKGDATGGSDLDEAASDLSEEFIQARASNTVRDARLADKRIWELSDGIGDAAATAAVQAFLAEYERLIDLAPDHGACRAALVHVTGTYLSRAEDILNRYRSIARAGSDASMRRAAAIVADSMGDITRAVKAERERAVAGDELALSAGADAVDRLVEMDGVKRDA